MKVIQRFTGGARILIQVQIVLVVSTRPSPKTSRSQTFADLKQTIRNDADSQSRFTKYPEDLYENGWSQFVKYALSNVLHRANLTQVNSTSQLLSLGISAPVLDTLKTVLQDI